MNWPHLAIRRLNVADDIRFLIGWTGSPASSNQLVGEVQEKKKQSQAEYLDFLRKSKLSVEQLAHALEKHDAVNIKEAVTRNREALLTMGQQTNVVIETPQLRRLIEIAHKFGAVAKTSGAGGGDSGIAFVFEDTDLEKVLDAWKDAGITHLPFSVYQH